MPAYPRPNAGRFPFIAAWTPKVRAAWRVALLTAALGGTPHLAGCSGAGPRPPEERLAASDVRGLDEAARYLRRTPAPEGERPALMVDAESIAFESLRDALSEAAGAAVVEEAVLDARLRAEAARAGVTLTKDMIEAERARFEASLAAGGVDADNAGAALERVRRQRGLGPARYAALLGRNALLRAMVQPEVSISGASIEQARALRYGEKRRVRVITTATAGEAAAARSRLERGEAFASVAAEVSTDTSAARGGLIGNVSAADPAYPVALRRAIESGGVGTVAGPVSVDGGFALVLVEGVSPAETPGADADALLERDARERQERLLMDALARRLASRPGVRVLDPALSWGAGG